MCSLNLFTIELSLVATNDEYFNVKIYLIDAVAKWGLQPPTWMIKHF